MVRKRTDIGITLTPTAAAARAPVLLEARPRCRPRCALLQVDELQRALSEIRVIFC